VNGFIPDKPELSIDQFLRSFLVESRCHLMFFLHGKAPQARISSEKSTFSTKKPEILGIQNLLQIPPRNPGLYAKNQKCRVSYPPRSTLNDSLMTESSPVKTSMAMFSPVRKARELASESTEFPKSSPSKSESLQLSPTPKLSPSKMSPSKSSMSNFSPSKCSPSKLNFLQFSPQKSNLSLCFQLVNKVYNLESVIKNNNRELNDQMHKVRTDIHKQVENIETMIKEHLENDGSSPNSRKSDSDLKTNVTDLNGRMTGLENSVKFCTEMTLQTNEFFKNLESERRVEKQRENKIANDREDKLLGIISKFTDDTKYELIKNENIKHQKP